MQIKVVLTMDRCRWLGERGDLAVDGEGQSCVGVSRAELRCKDGDNAMSANNLTIGRIDRNLGLPLGVVCVNIVRVDWPCDPVRLRGGGSGAILPRDGGDLTVGAARATRFVALLESGDGVLIAIVRARHRKGLV